VTAVHTLIADANSGPTWNSALLNECTTGGSYDVLAMSANFYPSGKHEEKLFGRSLIYLFMIYLTKLSLDQIIVVPKVG
jgi:hypothetical protein